MDKCFRHLKGAALILQTRTTATQFCSSVLGRNLLKWYTLIEDECTLLLSCGGLLPQTWRQEDYQIRKFIAASEYSETSKDQLGSRVLDDVMQVTVAIEPNMAEALAMVSQLNRSTGDERAKTVVRLESKLIRIIDHVESLRTSRLVIQLVQAYGVGFPWMTRHSECCPELPFPPFRFVYPPAGIVSILLLAIRLYVQVICYAPKVADVQVVLYPPIKAAGIRFERLERDSKLDEYDAYEICRGYAAIEDEFGDDLSCLLACLRPFSVAGFACPPELRSWYWHKLAHFEQLAPKYSEPVRRYVAVLWGMPEVVALGFESWKQTPPDNRIAALTSKNMSIAANIVVTTSQQEESDETEEE